ALLGRDRHRPRLRRRGRDRGRRRVHRRPARARAARGRRHAHPDARPLTPGAAEADSLAGRIRGGHNGPASDRRRTRRTDGEVAVILRFADCELDLARIVLRRGGRDVRLEPKAFDVLAYLVQRRGTVVRKHELLDEIWGDRFVSESALTTRIKAVRQAVDDDGNRQAVIRTVHGKGYEFVAPVEVVADGPTPP